MSNETTRRAMTARECYEKGLREEQFDDPFRGGVSPEEKRATAEEEANRRRNAERWRLGHRELYERGLRSLEEPAGDAPATSVSAPATPTAKPIDPLSEEAVTAREAALDRLLARTWPGRRSE